MGGGYTIVDTITKYFYDLIYRYRRNKSEKHKTKLKQLAKRDKEIAEELKPIQEQLKLLTEKEHKLTKESDSINSAKIKILSKYEYTVRKNRRLNPHYAG